MKINNYKWIIPFIILFVSSVIFFVMVDSHSGIGHKPLFFTMENEDTYSHKIVVEIFNTTGASIFVDRYTLNPGQFIVSPKIIDETNDGDTYIYKATLENNMTETYNFTVDADAVASIIVYNNSQNGEAYIDFGYTIG